MGRGSSRASNGRNAGGEKSALQRMLESTRKSQQYRKEAVEKGYVDYLDKETGVEWTHIHGKWETFAEANRVTKKLADSGTISKNSEQKALKSETSNIKKNNAGITTYIKQQTNLDIEKYRDSTTKGFDKSRGWMAGVNVDWKRMPETERQKIRLLSKNGRIKLTDNGSWMKLIQWT